MTVGWQARDDAAGDAPVQNGESTYLQYSIGPVELAVAEHRRVTARPEYARLPVAIRADHWVDAARGHVLIGDVVSAGRALVQADRLAPAEVRARPAAREVLSLVLRRSVRPDPLLAEIGRLTGVDGLR